MLVSTRSAQVGTSRPSKSFNSHVLRAGLHLTLSTATYGLPAGSRLEVSVALSYVMG